MLASGDNEGRLGIRGKLNETESVNIFFCYVSRRERQERWSEATASVWCVRNESGLSRLSSPADGFSYTILYRNNFLTPIHAVIAAVGEFYVPDSAVA